MKGAGYSFKLLPGIIPPKMLLIALRQTWNGLTATSFMSSKKSLADPEPPRSNHTMKHGEQQCKRHKPHDTLQFPLSADR